MLVFGAQHSTGARISAVASRAAGRVVMIAAPSRSRVRCPGGGPAIWIMRSALRVGCKRRPLVIRSLSNIRAKPMLRLHPSLTAESVAKKVFARPQVVSEPTNLQRHNTPAWPPRHRTAHTPERSRSCRCRSQVQVPALQIGGHRRCASPWSHRTIVAQNGTAGSNSISKRGQSTVRRSSHAAVFGKVHSHLVPRVLRASFCLSPACSSAASLCSARAVGRTRTFQKRRHCCSLCVRCTRVRVRKGRSEGTKK